jgi:hypothetical protein
MKIIQLVRRGVGKVIPTPYKVKILRQYYKLTCRGKGVVCTVCNQEFRKFCDTEDPNDFICSNCGAHSRHRLLVLYLRHQTRFFVDHLRVLHFAPEAALRDKFSAIHNHSYLAADLNSELASIKIDITSIGLAGNSIDAILCYHVLEHILEDQKAMREMHRVLRPGGWAILQPPIDYSRENTYEDASIVSPEDRVKHFGQRDHVRIYGRDYKDRLIESGFTVTVDDFVKKINTDDLQRYGLDRRELIYRCDKPRDMI